MPIRSCDYLSFPLFMSKLPHQLRLLHSSLEYPILDNPFSIQIRATYLHNIDILRQSIKCFAELYQWFNCSMQIEEIQVVIGECHKVICLLEEIQSDGNGGSEDIERIKKKIRESRIAVISMHYEAKLEKTSVARRREMERQIRALQREIELISACKHQEDMQSNKLSRLSGDIQAKMAEIDKKINTIKVQQLRLVDQFESIDQSLALEKILNEKQAMVNNTKKQFQQQERSFRQRLAERRKDVDAVYQAINGLDDKTFDLEEKIRSQLHVIREIMEGEGDKVDFEEVTDTNDVVILSKDEEKLFVNRTPLQVWQKYEVEDLRSKRQQQRKDEHNSISRVIRLRNRTQNMFGKIIRNRKYASFSQDQPSTRQNSHAVSRKSLPMMQRSEQLSYKFHMADLQKNKRIRTRITQMGKYPQSTKYQTSRRQVPSIKDEYEIQSKSVNIVDKYEKLRQKVEGNKSSSIEVIKLAKLTNRKRRMVGKKGVAVE